MPNVDDRPQTHWLDCWKSHHECAITRVEVLQSALNGIRRTCENFVAPQPSLPGMERTK